MTATLRQWATVPVLLAFLLGEVGHAETSYYVKKEEGWFWRQVIPDPPDPEELLPAQPEPPPPPVPVPPEAKKAPEGPQPLSPAWLREKLPEYRDRAIASPSPDNVRAYYYLQRYAMDKAERFAQVAQQVVLSDPSLDENARRPISSYGGQVFDKLAQEQTEQVAREIATQAGVWYFFGSDCPYCRAQNPILERLRTRIGLVILPISMDGKPMAEGAFKQFVPDRGHAKELGITQTPTLFLVRDGKQFALLSEGLTTDDELIERIVLVAHDAGWISDEEFNSTLPRKPSSLADEEFSASIDANDPAQILEWLRAHVGDGATGRL